MARHLEHTFDQAQTQIGTPYYLSPELCRNEAYGPKSDMWELGVVMYEILSFKRPFEASNILALVNSITTGEPGPIPTYALSFLNDASCLLWFIYTCVVVGTSEYSFDLRALVNCLLAKEYQQRPSVNTTLILPFLRPHIKTHLQSLRSTKKKKRSSSTTSPPPADIPDLDEMNQQQSSSTTPASAFSSSSKHVYHCGKCGKAFNTGERYKKAQMFLLLLRNCFLAFCLVQVCGG